MLRALMLTALLVATLGSHAFAGDTTFPLPTGSKSYSGTFIGSLTGTTILPGQTAITFVTLPMNGRASSTADFDTGSVEITFNFPATIPDGALGDFGAPGKSPLGDITITGAGFATPDIVICEPGGPISNGTRYSINGSFIGKHAREMFGSFTGSDPSFNVTGTFALFAEDDD
jgi:hypothetical protein